MSTAALERQIKPIYDSLDTGSPKTAVVTCNKLLKKHPKNNLIKALKALALVRLQKVEESIVLCDEVLAAKSTDDSTLSAMQHVLRGLGRHHDMIAMWENAYKQQPGNEELAAQTFFANVRTGNWKTAQQLAGKMHKQFQEDRYLYWSVISTVLQANDPTTPPNMRPILLKLAHRLISSSSTSTRTSDRLYLHLTLLRQLELYDEAYILLESEVAKHLCATSLLCNEVRRDIWKFKGLLTEEGLRAEERIVEISDRNWLEFLSVLDATFADLKSADAETSDSDKASCSEKIANTRTFLEGIAEKDSIRDRSAVLALLELEKRARSYGLSPNTEYFGDLLERYFRLVGDKACCFEDLKPYLDLQEEDLTRWTAFLNESTLSSDSVSNLRRSINVHILLRHNLTAEQTTHDLESNRATTYLRMYLVGLQLGKSLASTELQPADDLAILTGQTYVNLWKLTNHVAFLHNAVVILEFGLTKSKQSYQMRLMLVRIYTLLGAPSPALEHYRALNVRQVQNDTLSHFVLSRASTFSLAASGDLTYSSECIESSQIYMSNSQDTSDWIVRAFTSEKYSQIPDFINFEDRLDNSLARDSVKVEHVRMRVTHEPVSSDLIDLELVELKFIFNRVHHDNRDFEILPNYQPRSASSFDAQTLLFEKSIGSGWLSAFLKMYISILQQASDLDDSVEEKLLVGDRPKQSYDPESKIPWNERLTNKSQAELDELTPDELSLYDYVSALAKWLEPYHNHTRPSPAAVLAEVTKNNGGKSLKGAELSPSNGASANGHSKKDDDAPPIQEAPEIITKFFEDMNIRFKGLLERKSLPSELLHIVSLTQEALILFSIDTFRFKTASVVKVHKLGALVQMFKSIRTKAVTSLREMSDELVQAGELEGTADRRKAVTEGCKPVTTFAEIDHDFALNIAKKITDAQKKVLEGIGKGAAKLCTTYSAA